MMMWLIVMQICFWWRNLLNIVVFIVCFRLVLLSIMNGLLLFSFSVMCLRCVLLLVMWLMLWFIGVDLVKVIRFGIGCLMKVLLILLLGLIIMLNSLVGSLVFLKICVSSSLLQIGVLLVGLIIIVLFSVRVGVMECWVRCSGKFYGLIILIMLMVLWQIWFFLFGMLDLMMCLCICVGNDVDFRVIVCVVFYLILVFRWVLLDLWMIQLMIFLWWWLNIFIVLYSIVVCVEGLSVVYVGWILVVLVQVVSRLLWLVCLIFSSRLLLNGLFIFSWWLVWLWCYLLVRGWRLRLV